MLDGKPETLSHLLAPPEAEQALDWLLGDHGCDAVVGAAPAPRAAPTGLAARPADA